MEYGYHLLAEYGYWAIFVAVLLDFLGAPITTVPMLLVAGVAAGAGRMSLELIVLLAASAALSGDSLWYSLGRIRGQAVLGLICKLSRNRNRCVARTNHFITQHGAASLLLSKFIPGIATLASPAAGAAGMPLPKFLLLDAAGSFLWSAVFSAAGYALGRRSHTLIDAATHSSYWIAGVGAAAITIFVVVSLRKKYLSGGGRIVTSEAGLR